MSNLPAITETTIDNLTEDLARAEWMLDEFIAHGIDYRRAVAGFVFGGGRERIKELLAEAYERRDEVAS